MWIGCFLRGACFGSSSSFLSAPFSSYTLVLSLSLSLSLSNSKSRGDWVAQSVKHLSLGFGTGHVLTLGECEPCTGRRADSREFA